MFEHEEKCKFNVIPVSCADSSSLAFETKSFGLVSNLIIGNSKDIKFFDRKLLEN